jgi:cyclic pyranopterin phosphate synthase
MSEFSHLDKHGNVKMVDVTDKVTTARMAKAEGKITMLPETISAIQNDALPKGNVLTTA